MDPHKRRWLLSALLVALLTRFLIPAGYMPAADFSFQICPDGFPAHLLQSAADPHAGHHDHHQPNPAAGEATASDPAAGDPAAGDPNGTGETHRHSTAGTEHCAFAGAATAGPTTSAPAAFFAAAAGTDAPDDFYVSPALAPLRFRVQQPRGPPALS